MSDYQTGEDAIAQRDGEIPTEETLGQRIESHIPYTEEHEKKEFGQDIKEVRKDEREAEKEADKIE